MINRAIHYCPDLSGPVMSRSMHFGIMSFGIESVNHPMLSPSPSGLVPSSPVQTHPLHPSVSYFVRTIRSTSEASIVVQSNPVLSCFIQFRPSPADPTRSHYRFFYPVIRLHIRVYTIQMIVTTLHVSPSSLKAMTQAISRVT